MSEQTQNPFEQDMSQVPNTANDPFAQTTGGQNTGGTDPFVAVNPPPAPENPPEAVPPSNVPNVATNAVNQAAVPGIVPGQTASTPVNPGNQANPQNMFETPGAVAPPPPTPAPPPTVNVEAGFQQAATPPPVTAPPPLTAPPDFTNGAANGQMGLFPSTGTAPAAQQQGQITTAAVSNPIVAAVEQQEQGSIFAKPPVFSHGSVNEPIENLDQTFEELREAKSEDFPELEDAVRVSWDITYGKIRKTVPTPKKTKIGEFKRTIESSKEFLDALKKDKDKSPNCVIKPRITAQSKGENMPSYKGIFANLEEAQASGKVISIVPGRNGKVYEIRNTEAGEFVTPTNDCKELSEIEAGFNPALPLIPHEQLLQIISFFRSLMTNGRYYEAIANILWDRERQEFYVHVPEQRVTAVKADSSLEMSDEYDSERFLHYMDVHSHNAMSARFSKTDDADEKATRVYAVIGKLNDYIPEISVRISNGGKYLLIDPAIVFESLGDFYPVEWNNQVTFEDGGQSRYENPRTLHLKNLLLESFKRGGLMCA